MLTDPLIQFDLKKRVSTAMESRGTTRTWPEPAARAREAHDADNGDTSAASGAIRGQCARLFYSTTTIVPVFAAEDDIAV
jgi:hypothetical protein